LLGLASALLVALLAPASGWTYADGTYKGKTSQGLAVSVKVKTVRALVGPRGHRRILLRRYVDEFGVSITDTCPDGFRDAHPDYFKRTDRRLGAPGRFAYVINPGPEPLRFAGRITGGGLNSLATGTASDVTANAKHRGRCASGVVTWTATRNGRPPPVSAPTPLPTTSLPGGSAPATDTVGQTPQTSPSFVQFLCPLLPGAGTFSHPLLLGTITQTTVARLCQPLTSGPGFNHVYFSFTLPSSAPSGSYVAAHFETTPDALSAVHPRLASTGGVTLKTSSSDGVWFGDPPNIRAIPIDGLAPGTYILGFEKLDSPLRSLTTPYWDAAVLLG
jgi:hypothetical protein